MDNSEKHIDSLYDTPKLVPEGISYSFPEENILYQEIDENLKLEGSFDGPKTLQCKAPKPIPAPRSLKMTHSVPNTYTSEPTLLPIKKSVSLYEGR